MREEHRDVPWRGGFGLFRTLGATAVPHGELGSQCLVPELDGSEELRGTTVTTSPGSWLQSQLCCQLVI